jgi:hypothetical protein
MHKNNTKNLCRYLYLKLEKSHVSCFIFYGFSSIKSENRRVEQVLLGGEGRRVIGKGGREGGGSERGRRMNMVQTVYAQVCKCQNDTC